MCWVVQAFDKSDIMTTPSNGVEMPDQFVRLKSCIKLALKLCQHTLRDCVTNKKNMVPFVPLLQDWLGGGTGAADVLREM